MADFRDKTEARFTSEELISLLLHLLYDYKLNNEEALEKACEQYPGFRDIVQVISSLRFISTALSKGELEAQVPSLGYVVSNLKALQSNLSHLVWQMAQVSKGDFSQRVDFLGDFSTSFNLMCETLERHNLELTELARLDSLTKLANRQHLDEFLETLFADNTSTWVDFSLLMIDVDFFKQVNDTYGHDIGDIVLEQVAKYLMQVFRASDFIARYGGEEFIVVLPSANLDQTLLAADRVLTYFRENPITVNDDLRMSLTVSIGIAIRQADDTSWEQVVKRSDVALYYAKNNGRDRVEFELPSCISR